LKRFTSGVPGAKLGIYGSTPSTTKTIVTGQDASSVSVNTSFANAAGISATDYKPTTGNK
jgi:hypothetical protein